MFFNVLIGEKGNLNIAVFLSGLFMTPLFLVSTLEVAAPEPPRPGAVGHPGAAARRAFATQRPSGGPDPQPAGAHSTLARRGVRNSTLVSRPESTSSC